MVSLMIVADDLTGAADTASRCVVAGLRATVALHVPATTAADALACTSDSRHLPPDQAAAAVRDLARQLNNLHPQRWYKKIDSTLRGNLGAEIDALLDTLDISLAIICPAFPAQQRGLREGLLVVEPPLAAPPDLPAILRQQSRYPVAAISLANIRARPGRLAERIAGARQSARLLVCDALADADLQTIAAAADLAAPDALLCGSAGLAGALAPRLAAPLPARREHAMIHPPDGPALLVIGSGSGAAQRQIATALHERRLTDYIPGAPPSDLSADALLHLPPPAAGTQLDGDAARRLASALADAAIERMTMAMPALLILSGGDTAIAVLERLRIARLAVIRELLPGIPLCIGDTPAGQSVAVILKPGGFGDDRALITLLDRARSSEG